MSWSGIVLTLALFGAELRSPSLPTRPVLPRPMELGIGSSPGRPAPWSCRPMTMGRRGSCEWLDSIQDNLCPEGLVDEMTIAAARVSVGAAAGRKPLDPAKAATTKGASRRRPGSIIAPPSTDDQADKEVWPLTLREAIHFALSPGEVARVLSPPPGPPIQDCFAPDVRDDGEFGPIVIARPDSSASRHRFSAEVMAIVRSVEEKYGTLAQAHAQLWAADRIVSKGKEMLDREPSELMESRGSIADTAEVGQRLDQLKRDLVCRKSEVVIAERELRDLLGLPPTDGRRIIPVTPPTHARIEPDWDSSLSEMLAHQPDVVQQRMLVRLAELGLLIARNQILPPLGPQVLQDLKDLGSTFDYWQVYSAPMVIKSLPTLAGEQYRGASAAAVGGSPWVFLSWQTGYTFQMPMGLRYPFANARSAQYILIRSRARYQQIVHQTAHTLAASFLAIDSNEERVEEAARLRRAAEQRLDASRKPYKEGRITALRYLDAIEHHTTAVATESCSRIAYHLAIVGLEEAKGTLLAFENIAVADNESAANSAAIPPVAIDGTGARTIMGR